jgi:N-acetylated-alpha-linked acidic dipeptidase
MSEVSRDIDDPETRMTVWERAHLSAIASAPPDKRAERRSRADLQIGALGSGSDYTVFIDHLGVASLDFGYGGEGDGGSQYHSIYDDYNWYTHYSDSDFSYGRALAQTAGTALMRLAGAEVLPFQFTNLAGTVKTYLDELKKLAADQRAEIEERNRQLEEGVFRATADPKKKSVPPTKDPVPPYLNFAPLENAVDLLTRSAAKYETALAKAGAGAPASVNAKLIDSERRLTDPAGLPNRNWYQHMIYAPGFYTGYDVKTIPGVREAIEQKRWTEADVQIARAAKVLENEADLLESAAAELSPR